MAAFSKSGEDKVLGHLNGIEARFRVGLAEAAQMAGQLLVRTTHEGMASAGGGRLYAGQKRQSGAPGGYPAIQSGQLKGSIDFEANASRLVYGSRGAFNRGFDYAIAQETGTSKMAARPYATLTVRKTGAQVAQLLGEVTWRRMIGG